MHSVYINHNQAVCDDSKGSRLYKFSQKLTDVQKDYLIKEVEMLIKQGGGSLWGESSRESSQESCS